MLTFHTKKRRIRLFLVFYMQRVKAAVRQNALLISSLATHPVRLRVEDDEHAVLPRIVHDSRRFLVGIQRQINGDCREDVCHAIDVTVTFLQDLLVLDRVFTAEMLTLNLEDGLDAFAKFYFNDSNVDLCRAKAISVLKPIRARFKKQVTN